MAGKVEVVYTTLNPISLSSYDDHLPGHFDSTMALPADCVS